MPTITITMQTWNHVKAAIMALVIMILVLFCIGMSLDMTVQKQGKELSNLHEQYFNMQVATGQVH